MKLLSYLENNRLFILKIYIRFNSEYLMKLFESNFCQYQ